MRRITDTDEKSVFRTDRFFAINGQWFFATREGKDQGPYRRQQDAQLALREYLNDKAGIRPKDVWSRPGGTH